MVHHRLPHVQRTWATRPVRPVVAVFAQKCAFEPKLPSRQPPPHPLHVAHLAEGVADLVCQGRATCPAARLHDPLGATNLASFFDHSLQDSG